MTSPANLVRLMRASAARFADRPAVTDDRCTLTYAELDARSAALAARLVARGVRPGDRVAVHLPRGVGVFVAVLGILKAGAAYVAVDLRYPQARRDFMIAESEARMVLVEPGESAVDVDGCQTWPVRPEEVTGSDQMPELTTPADAVACVLFTSGSSGRPKGVLLEHGNLVFFATNPALPAPRPGERVGQISSLSFDAFHYEAWCSLAHGATVVVLPTIPDLLAADLQRELRRRRIDVLLAPTMAVNQVLRQDSAAFSPLRLLLTGGDVLYPATCRELLRGPFSGRFVNLYGPTEISTACTSYDVESLPEQAETVPIGRPLAGVTLYVLDDDLRPVPDGEPGQLHVAGPGVARGYLRQPELTRQRFWSGADNVRTYATGDLVVRRPDGVFEFVGRVDDQVKIRGFRVELGEVARVLQNQDGVREATVLAAGEGQDRRLVAFVVADDGVTPATLRTVLSKQLPDFMVPATILMLPELPVDAHGKRDRQRLREILAQHEQRRAAHRPPRSSAEIYLAKLWADLLSVEQVGTDDDFFLLGGHSLLVVQLRRRIMDDTGLVLEFPEVLGNSRLADLANVITARQQADA